MVKYDNSLKYIFQKRFCFMESVSDILVSLKSEFHPCWCSSVD